jgi:hypothetical protein
MLALMADGEEMTSSEDRVMSDSNETPSSPAVTVQPTYDAYSDPIVSAIYGLQGTPVLERFAAMRPDASEHETGAVQAWVMVINIGLVNITRITSKLDTAVLKPGAFGISPADYAIVPTAFDTPAERARVAALLTAPLTQPLTVPPASIDTDPETPPRTTCRFFHSGQYL